MVAFKYQLGAKVSAPFGGKGVVVAHEIYQSRPCYLVRFKNHPQEPHLCLETELTFSKSWRSADGRGSEQNATAETA